jgi:hypothetical protein
MSGLEALVALGLTCNIFQTITFGCEIITLAKHVYQSGTLDNAIHAYAGELRGVADGIRTACPHDSSKALSLQDKQLLKLSRTCCTAARELQEEVEFIIGNAQRGSLLATIKVAAKANWRKRRLDRIEGELHRAESVLQAGLLGQIWLVSPATAIRRC